MELYRYEISNNFEEESKLHLITFYVIKETKCGYWINKTFRSKDETSFCHSKDKFVYKEGRKIYARPEKQSALGDFICRMTKHFEFINDRCRTVKYCLKTAKELYEKNI